MPTKNDFSTERVTIERLKPAHLDGVVTLHVNAFPNSFLTLLGSGFLRELYSSFLADPLGVGLVIRSENGEVLASAVGVLKPHGFFRRLVLRRWWAFCLKSIKAAIGCPAIIPRLVRALTYRGGPPQKLDRALLSSLSVAPNCQGKGLGRLLLEHWCKEMRRAGAMGCFLTTDADNNEAVNRFYKSSGWKLNSSYTTPEQRRMNLYVYDFDTASSPAHPVLSPFYPSMTGDGGPVSCPTPGLSCQNSSHSLKAKPFFGRFW